jgi:CRP/FNR family transcriptional regulator, cyclic AMP receptor protein
MVDVISRTPLFAGCTKDELRDVAAACSEVSLAAGETFIREGERGREFFVIVDGTATTTQDGRELSRQGPGDWVGEIALISAERRSATVTTTSPAKLLVLSDEKFQRLLNDVPSIAAKVQASFRERQRPVEHVVMVEFEAADGRRWSAIGGGPSYDDAVRFARDCCPPDAEWELVGSNALHGD